MSSYRLKNTLLRADYSTLSYPKTPKNSKKIKTAISIWTNQKDTLDTRLEVKGWKGVGHTHARGHSFQTMFSFSSATYFLQQDAEVRRPSASQDEHVEVCKLCESFSSFHVRRDSASLLHLSPTYTNLGRALYVYVFLNQKNNNNLISRAQCTS